jgi:hypothetical protein
MTTTMGQKNTRNLDAFAGPYAGGSPVEMMEEAPALGRALDNLDATLAGADTADLARLADAVRDAAAVLDDYDPQDRSGPVADAERRTARTLARCLREHADDRRWGRLLWLAVRTSQWMRSLMTEDERWDHDYCMPWPDLEELDAAAAAALAGEVSASDNFPGRA